MTSLDGLTLSELEHFLERHLGEDRADWPLEQVAVHVLGPLLSLPSSVCASCPCPSYLETHALPRRTRSLSIQKNPLSAPPVHVCAVAYAPSMPFSLLLQALRRHEERERERETQSHEESSDSATPHNATTQHTQPTQPPSTQRAHTHTHAVTRYWIDLFCLSPSLCADTHQYTQHLEALFLHDHSTHTHNSPAHTYLFVSPWLFAHDLLHSAFSQFALFLTAMMTSSHDLPALTLHTAFCDNDEENDFLHAWEEDSGNFVREYLLREVEDALVGLQERHADKAVVHTPTHRNLNNLSRSQSYTRLSQSHSHTHTPRSVSLSSARSAHTDSESESGSHNHHAYSHSESPDEATQAHRERVRECGDALLLTVLETPSLTQRFVWAVDFSLKQMVLSCVRTHVAVWCEQQRSLSQHNGSTPPSMSVCDGLCGGECECESDGVLSLLQTLTQTQSQTHAHRQGERRTQSRSHALRRVLHPSSPSHAASHTPRSAYTHTHTRLGALRECDTESDSESESDADAERTEREAWRPVSSSSYHTTRTHKHTRRVCVSRSALEAYLLHCYEEEKEKNVAFDLNLFDGFLSQWLDTLSQLYLTLQERDNAELTLVHSLTTLKNVCALMHPQRITAVLRLAMFYALHGETNAAEGLFASYMDTLRDRVERQRALCNNGRKSTPRNSAEYRGCVRALCGGCAQVGQWYVSVGLYPAAIALFAEGYKHARSLWGTVHAHTLRALLLLVNTRVFQYPQWEQALKECDAALSECVRVENCVDLELVSQLCEARARIARALQYRSSSMASCVAREGESCQAVMGAMWERDRDRESEKRGVEASVSSSRSNHAEEPQRNVRDQHSSSACVIC